VENDKLGRVLLINTWKDACESQGKKPEIKLDIETLLKKQWQISH
jgi:hypothetical protein